MMVIKLRKVMYGVLFAAFLFVTCQIARLIATVWRDEASFSCNAWGAFGMPFSPFTLFILALSAFLLFFYGWRAAKDFSEEWPWLVLIASGMSNFSERLMYGCVTDYVFLSHLPAFNAADVLLTIGTAVILWRALFNKSPSSI
jgi:lipoprotein signal peptidase